MEFFGIGLHVIVALFFAVHALRSGQPIYWLFILFSFPLMGSVVYFFAIYLPDSRLQTGAQRVLGGATSLLNPGRELRDAQAAFDYTPTAQNQMRLAAAQLQAGEAVEAARNYEACLKGPFATDPEMKYCTALAWMEAGQHANALTHLAQIRATDSHFRPEQMALLMARALQGAGRSPEARSELERAVQRFGSFEAKAEFAIWAYQQGDRATASRLQAELDQTLRHWNKHNKALNAPLLRRLAAAAVSSTA